MDVSLFKRLGEAHPEAVVCLTTQYRMNEEVMALCNTLIYEHRLTCGNEQVARARLQLTNNPSFVGMSMGSSAWIRGAIDPCRSVIFLNTDRVDWAGLFGDRRDRSDVVECDESSFLDSEVMPLKPALNRMKSSSTSGGSRLGTSSEIEAAVVRAVLIQLERCGVKPADVGVISPYRAQVRLIQTTLANLSDAGTATANEDKSPGAGHCERGVGEGSLVSTVDKFQGRDMDVIIISTVRNMQDKNVSISFVLGVYFEVCFVIHMSYRLVPIIACFSHF
jgi:DNA replication ATP-dependent helicase Dna2